MAKKAHFSPKLFQFLVELAQNNERTWFQANKERYERDVRDPVLAFITDFAPKLKKISPRYVADPRPSGGSLMRIYRDTRFAKDKTPYKTNVGISFRHEVGKDIHGPGFYVHLDPTGNFAGAGSWHPDPPSLAKYRAAIDEKGKAWTQSISGKAFKSKWKLEGERLSRPPKGFDPEHPLIEEIKRKDFIAVVPFTTKQTCSASFIDDLAASFQAIKPMMSFLARALDLEL